MSQSNLTAGAMTVSPKTVPGETERQRTDQEPPYKVILYNDDYNPMEHVVEALQKIISRVNEQKAVSIMLTAHTEGKAVVIECHKELAELYRDGLRGENLTATIEPG